MSLTTHSARYAIVLIYNRVLLHVCMNVYAYLYDTDGYSGSVRTYIAAGRFEYVGHIEYHHVYTAHLLKKHASHTDQHCPAVGLVRQYFR